MLFETLLLWTVSPWPGLAQVALGFMYSSSWLPGNHQRSSLFLHPLLPKSGALALSWTQPGEETTFDFAVLLNLGLTHQSGFFEGLCD